MKKKRYIPKMFYNPLLLVAVFSLISVVSMSCVSAQSLNGGLFPGVKDLSNFMPVKASSTCGLNGQSTTYCMSSVEENSLLSCQKESCLLECCDTCRKYSPNYIDLDKSAKTFGNVYVSNDRRPESEIFSSSRNFLSGGYLYTTNVRISTANFSFTAWIKQKSGNIGIIAEKEDAFKIILEEYTTTFIYHTKIAPMNVITLAFSNINFDQGMWHHFAFKVCDVSLDLFVDGVFARSGTLAATVANGKMFFKVGTKGAQEFIGFMQDVRFYENGLTNREVVESMTDNLPVIPYSHCHCPESHPRLAPNSYFHCMKNGASSGDVVMRLSERSHPPEFFVDGLFTYWISERVSQATLDIDLKYLDLQVYMVSIVFYTPVPLGIKIERSTNSGNSYQAWQYFAVDCAQTFNMANNGDLPYPDSVNCLQMVNRKPSWENIRFLPAEEGQGNLPKRPFGFSGCSDFHCSPVWLEFVKATNVRITLSGHSITNPPERQYFGVRRVVVAGRCDCFGHSTECTYHESPKYVCLCDARTFTTGEQCNRCLPLYNDKPFKRGTIFEANPCKKCECHSHAESCTYDPVLDEDLKDRDAPGGGVCKDCKHNMMGRHCNTCKPLFYRPESKAITAIDVCEPCNCVGPGVVTNAFDCQKDNTTVGILAGQCTCKRYVVGRQCTDCLDGYFQLSAEDLDGCKQCQCNPAGTVNNGVACHVSTGQCVCKTNIIGLKCTNCKIGHFGLSYANPLGCYPCNCNPYGSISADTCDLVTGQCTCKDRFEGRACDRCKQGFFGPKCEPCYCNVAGTIGLGAQCHKDTGQCSCKENVQGSSCSTCKPNFYGLSPVNPNGCLLCNCDGRGTKTNAGTCDQATGACSCKKYVVGQTCSICAVGTYKLEASNADGCEKCNCDGKGTVAGDKTAQGSLVCTSSGQCNCLPNVMGRSCNQCHAGFYWNTVGSGCISCNCNTIGSTSNSCDSFGRCQCRVGNGIGGEKCDECAEGFYNFVAGRCSPCQCNRSGRLASSCDNLGQCDQCKANVQGLKCDECKSGTKVLSDSNPFGCSGAPSQQNAPSIISQTSRQFVLRWLPPDNENGVLTKYGLYRNDTLVYSGVQLTFKDSGLIPYTVYSYYVLSHTLGGFSKSVDSAIFRTPGDVPEGVLPCEVSDIRDRSAMVKWFLPTSPNGVILRYALKSFTITNGFVTHYTGMQLQKQVTGLYPFTSYDFTVDVCNSEGCTSSPVITIQTLSSAPESQPAPYLQSLPGGTKLNVSWDPPTRPNGNVQYYDLHFWKEPFVGTDSKTASNLPPNVRYWVAENLTPFTFYRFRVTSHTGSGGSTSSKWTKVRTAEGVPRGESSINPSGHALNSTSLKLIWNPPSLKNGVILQYKVYRYDLNSPQLHHQTPVMEFVDINLQVYTEYRYSIQACNSVGCTRHSSPVLLRTKPSSPKQQAPLILESATKDSVTLKWSLPGLPNGPSDIHYVIEEYLPPFSYPPSAVEKGVRFPAFGYYELNSTIIQDSSTTRLELYFKTRYLDGLLFFAASNGQEDIMVVEFREGCPWFVFDTESGPAAFTISKNRTFNDNRWHHILVTRDMREGTIVIDGTYSGTGTGKGSKNVIGQISKVFIGALPEHYKIKREDYGDATLKKMPFVGCIKNLRYKDNLIDFNVAVRQVNVSPLTDYCVASLKPGLYFKGKGYLVLKEGIFKGTATFLLKFRIRTIQENALILYAFGAEDSINIFLKNGVLYFGFKTRSGSNVFPLAVFKLCDGLWHDIYIESKVYQLSAIVDGAGRPVTILPTSLAINSKVYIGGVPSNFTSRDLQDSYSGCLDELNIATVVHLPNNVDHFQNVDFDGCPEAGNTSPCRQPSIQEIYNGPNLFAEFQGLNSFTQYLFRVKSYQKTIPGFASSDWVPIRTNEGAPGNFLKPTIKSIGARTVRLKWFPPSLSAGLISHYILNGYISTTNRNRSYLIDSSLSSVSSMEGDLHNLEAGTLYLFTVQAFTLGGNVESEPVIEKTLEALPENLLPPVVSVTPTSLNISWKPPQNPNGDITYFEVQIDGEIKYTGKNLNTVIDNLQVYTEYTLKIFACGKMGCASTETKVFTGQLPPEGVIAPQLKVLGPNRISVKWSSPHKPNGIISRYELFVGQTLTSMTLNRVLNPLTFEAVIDNLKPGQLYYVKMKAYNNGGGTDGDVARATTIESAPANIPLPQVTAVGSTMLVIRIQPPASPNGVVKSYALLLDGISVFSWGPTPPIEYIANNLKAFSSHTIEVEVCTATGCGLSDKITVFTGHGKPVGIIHLSASVTSPHSVNSYWTDVAQPNGPLLYNLHVTGQFYIQSGLNFNTSLQTIVCYSGNATNRNVACAELLPFEKYELLVNASNDAGFVLSNKVDLETLPSAPEGIHTPNCVFLNSTTISLSWPPPSRPNGIIISYSIYALYQSAVSNVKEEFKLRTGIFTKHTVYGLTAFTIYHFRVEVQNIGGKGSSSWKNITTFEDVPSDFDAPKVSTIDSRYIILDISAPVKPNGIIIAYNIYLNGSLYSSTLKTSVNVTSLKPFTFYVAHVAACTEVGCLNSSFVDIRTFPAVPEGVYAPSLVANSSKSVVVRWSKPSISNGIINFYQIQRRTPDSPVISTLVSVPGPNFWNTYVDRTAKAYTIYEYRIVAQTSAGGSASPFTSVQTPEGEPSGIEPPVVFPLSPSSILVQWKPPKEPNGVITHYIISAGSQQISINGPLNFQHTVNNLLSYTLYYVRISACTKRGCGRSLLVPTRTLPSAPQKQQPPTAEVVSNSSLRVRWMEPALPNGPIQSYILEGRTLESVISENIKVPTDWKVLSEGLATVFDHQNLGIFSLQQYKVTCMTTEGNISSVPSKGFRTGSGFPMAGPALSVSVLNNTAVRLSWVDPPLKELKGLVKEYKIVYTVIDNNAIYDLGAFSNELLTVTINGLRPSTLYDFQVALNNGAGSKYGNTVRARTTAGVPEGFSAPVVYNIGPFDIRVSWKPPRVPNGDILNYTIIVNDVAMDTVSGDVTFHQQMNLTAFTVLSVKIRVCTEYICVLSDRTSVKTLSAAPSGMQSPQLIPLTSSSIRVKWSFPQYPNGMLVGYELFRRSQYNCPKTVNPMRTCTYVTCSIHQQLCGATCYDPRGMVCCNVTIHLKNSQKTCCGDNHLYKHSNDEVCCSNIFHPYQPLYQCCHGHYKYVPAGYICCPSNRNVVVGKGNACCGDVPFDDSGPQHCLCGTLYDKFPVTRQCCGGVIAASFLVCCGDEHEGKAYTYDRSKKCCGTLYNLSTNTMCCHNQLKQAKVHSFPSTIIREQYKCCGTNSIRTSEECCTNVGYNPQTRVCSDRNALDYLGCGSGNTCPTSQQASAYCNRCDFDTTNSICGYTNHTITGNETETSLCKTEFMEILANSKDPNLLSLTDINLSPHTFYEYYVTVFNDAGNSSSPTSNVKTDMAKPEGLHPPLPTVISANQIVITWLLPRKPNGRLSEYVLYRVVWATKETVAVYRGVSTSHSDVMNLQAHTAYMYVLSACTVQCANISAPMLVYTLQSFPTQVRSPILQAVSSSAIRVNWSEPLQPNGIIVSYNLTMLLLGEYRSIIPEGSSGMMMTILVSGLQPFTVYNFQLYACTVIGCAVSEFASVRTLQAAPTSVLPPRVVVVSGRRVEVAWVQPTSSNGIIQYYKLRRNATLLYNGTAREYNDTSVSPATKYTYSVEAFTLGGGRLSPVVVVHTPESSPEDIPAPRVQPVAFDALNITWTVPLKPHGAVSSYSIFYQEVDGPISKKGVGLTFQWLVSGLKAFTTYEFRVEACTVVGCGVSERGSGKTLESPPLNQDPPTVEAKSSAIIEVVWGPPKLPNGIISNYKVERRRDAISLPFIVYVGSRTDYLDSQLEAFTIYEYRVRSVNTIGEAISAWVSVKTMEGIPENIPAPTVTVTNSSTIRVSWERPGKTNGILTSYELRSRLFSEPQQISIVRCCIQPHLTSLQATGFLPFTSYEIQVSASNAAGSGYSAWTLVKLPEAPPSKIPVLQVNNDVQNSTTTSMQVYWSEPESSNGVVTNYVLYLDGSKVYEGLERRATIRRLKPLTNYTFYLEVCNNAGCTSGAEQVLRSGEGPTEARQPKVLFLNNTMVEIQWKATNGKVLVYQLIREEVAKRRRRNTGETIVFSTNDTSKDSFKFTDTSVKPFTKYRYKVRVFTDQGTTESDWIEVTTTEGIPVGFLKPDLSPSSGPVVAIQWTVPVSPNGDIRYYELLRNGSSIGSTTSTFYRDADSSLKPNTYYEYIVRACTNVGCGIYPSAVVLTIPTAPDEVLPPVLTALSSSSVKATWTAPRIPNGNINKYQLFIGAGALPIFEGYALQYTVNALTAFTEYVFSVSACTSEGCASSRNASVRTLEAPPETMFAPYLFVLGANSIEAKWGPPAKPNGVILYYVLMRSDDVLYNGTSVSFIDYTVQPTTTYYYTVSAHNSAGGTQSPVATSQSTDTGSPQNISAPTLIALSSTSVHVSWKKPSSPLNAIISYHVLYADIERNVGMTFIYTAVNLLPYTKYDFRIKVCTSSACGISPVSSVRTLESFPLNQRTPYFVSNEIQYNSINVRWDDPNTPNGVILHCEIFRRANTLSISVYKGKAKSFTDTDGIQPNTRYEYKVVCSNSKGSAGSLWSAVSSLMSPPLGILPIQVTRTAATSFSYEITVPSQPNGAITNYFLEVDGKNVSTTLTTGDVTGLNPHQDYYVRLYACNAAGCARGQNVVVVKTRPAPPQGFNKSPVVLWLTSTTAALEWSEPTYPNGVVQSYDVTIHHPCPQVAKPTSCLSNTSLLSAGQSRLYNVSNLTPFTLYKMKITARNSAGVVDSPTIDVTTKSENPVVLQLPTVVLSDNSANTIVVTWSYVFDLRSQLIEFVVTENNIISYNGNKYIMRREKRVPSKYTYVVTAFTEVGGVAASVSASPVSIVVGNSTVVTTTTTTTISPSAGGQSNEEVWYRTVWFLALCALAIVIILFLIIVCCCRGYRNNRSVYVRQRDPLPSKWTYDSRSVLESEYPSVKLTPRTQRAAVERYNRIPSRRHTPLRTYTPREITEVPEIRINDNFTNDDLIFDTPAGSTRDFDSGLYDDYNPPYVDDEIDADGEERRYKRYQTAERILFPDTRL